MSWFALGECYGGVRSVMYLHLPNLSYWNILDYSIAIGNITHAHTQTANVLLKHGMLCTFKSILNKTLQTLCSFSDRTTVNDYFVYTGTNLQPPAFHKNLIITFENPK